MVLIGNKFDLDERYQNISKIKKKFRREVSIDEGKEFARKNNMLFFETSAKTGFNIDDCFQQSCKSISKKINEDFYDLTNEVF